MLITIMEIFDMLVMALAIGFIFSDYFGRFAKRRANLRGFDWRGTVIAALITSPGIVLHEAMHKFVAISQGLQATFHASYFGLMIGIILKFANFGFIFFIPGYVATSGTGTNLQYAIIAIAGPLTNFALWLMPHLYLKLGKVSRRWYGFWYVFKQINLLLFVFNMLPIPGFDGFNFYYNMYKFLF